MQLGKYQLVRRLAVGGMAEVFLAKALGPMGFEKLVVVKRVLPHLAEEARYIEMFLAEAQLVARLDHPGVVQVFDFGTADGEYFLAMEFIDGANLRQLAQKAWQRDQPLPIGFCAKALAMACEGLVYVHGLKDPETDEPLELIHRDISPDNILVSRSGAVKVLDFGIAKARNQLHQTRTGVVKGKLSYMAPEQIQNRPLDARADVYALGVVLYELVTGQRPFQADDEVALLQAITSQPLVPPSSHRKDIPPALERVIETALARDREARFQSCRALHTALEQCAQASGEPWGVFQLAELVERLVPPMQGLLRPEPSVTLMSPLMPEPAPLQRTTPLRVREPRLPGEQPTLAEQLAAQLSEPRELERPSPSVDSPATAPVELQWPSPPPAVCAETPVELKRPATPAELQLPGMPLPPSALSRPRPLRRSAMLSGLAVLSLGGAFLGLAWKPGPQPGPPPAKVTATPRPEVTAKLSSQDDTNVSSFEDKVVSQPGGADASPPVHAGGARPRNEGTPRSTGPALPARSADAPLRTAQLGAPQPPQLATLTVKANLSAADVRVNGKWVGRAPITVPNLVPGTVRVQVFGLGFDRVETFAISKGTNVRTLEIQKGFLAIKGVPEGALVMLDGEQLGPAPVKREVFEGEHRVTFSDPDTGRATTIRCIATPGASKPCDYSFEPGSSARTSAE